uniref:serine O-acetyltransferase n=1 Tax=Oryza punctata TaxID=4537 RepID=A0A0E0JX16_ORYPU
MTTRQPLRHEHDPSPPESDAAYDDEEESRVWSQIKAEARRDADGEPALASFVYATVLSHPTLAGCLAFHLANKLASSTLLSSTLLYDLFVATHAARPDLRAAAVADLLAAGARDPACAGCLSHCLLNYKGFLAIQSHRVAHALWAQGRRALALALQSRVAEVFAVDIHPAAAVGSGVLLDHATGVVIGETAVVGDGVSILHHVTLGGTGKAVGDRHPKVGDGVLIGAGATILGNVRIGAGAKIGAGSLVLADVPPGGTAVGNPAKLLLGGDKRGGVPAVGEEETGAETLAAAQLGSAAGVAEEEEGTAAMLAASARRMAAAAASSSYSKRANQLAHALNQQRWIHDRNKKAMELVAKGWSALQEVDRVIDYADRNDKRLIPLLRGAKENFELALEIDNMNTHARLWLAKMHFKYHVPGACKAMWNDYVHSDQQAFYYIEKAVDQVQKCLRLLPGSTQDYELKTSLRR